MTTRMSRLFHLVAAFLLLSTNVLAQKTCVLWDKTNHIPVSRASVYTTHQGKARSVFSDREGRVAIDFAFDSLHVSHINYQKKCVTALPDTLLMEQATQILSELVVYSGEPAWIRPMLKHFVKTKQEKYRHDGPMRYEYHTQNLGDTLLYRFESKGLVRRNRLFEIAPVENTIVYKDSTAGCDYSNLKNTLYHDFVTDMDEKFVREHRFYLDNEAQGLADHVVKILFKSEKPWKDSGYLCMDTLRHVILRARRSTGLQYNVKDRTNPFVRSLFRVFYGHQYKDWQIDTETEYGLDGKACFLTSCRYSSYMQEVFDSPKGKREQVFHLTSTYRAQPCHEAATPGTEAFLVLPQPFAMKIVMTKKEARQREMLQNVKRKYELY